MSPADGFWDGGGCEGRSISVTDPCLLAGARVIAAARSRYHDHPEQGADVFPHSRRSRSPDRDRRDQHARRRPKR